VQVTRACHERSRTGRRQDPSTRFKWHRFLCLHTVACTVSGVGFPVNDSDIRESAHRKIFRRHHNAANTLVIDELGLRHGSARADIVVVNGKLAGYEIKSERDSLRRLRSQIGMYDAVFDSITLIVSPRHRSAATRHIPRHWGIILAQRGKRGAVHFDFQRKPRSNRRIDLFSIAQLLWRTEAVQLLRLRNASNRLLRLPRATLYRHLVSTLPAEALRAAVRNCLRNRRNWRHREPSFQYDDSCRPTAKS